MSGGRASPAARREAGVALLIVVWLLALLTVIAQEFVYSGRYRARAEANKRDDLRGLALAMAGYRKALAELDQKIEGLKVEEGALFLKIAGRDWEKARGEDEPLGAGTYSWSISDEEGLVNVNKASSSDLAKLLKACGMEPGTARDTVIDSIIDWRDPSRGHQLNGADEDYYRGLTPPYSCKDGPLDVVEELLLVKGVTPELFAGSTKDGKKLPGLRELVSARDPADQKMNWQTAPQRLLDAFGLSRPAGSVVSNRYAIVATGAPAGEAPKRRIRAVVLKKPGSSPPFTLLYWNDNYTPPD